MIHQFYTVSLAPGANSGNILAGKTLELLGRRHAMRVGLVASATGLVVTVLNEREQIAVNEPVMVKATPPVDPDDFHIEYVGVGRQQIIINNPTAGAITYTMIVKGQPF